MWVGLREDTQKSANKSLIGVFIGILEGRRYIYAAVTKGLITKGMDWRGLVSVCADKGSN